MVWRHLQIIKNLTVSKCLQVSLSVSTVNFVLFCHILSYFVIFRHFRSIPRTNTVSQKFHLLVCSCFTMNLTRDCISVRIERHCNSSYQHFCNFEIVFQVFVEFRKYCPHATPKCRIPLLPRVRGVPHLPEVLTETCLHF